MTLTKNPVVAPAHAVCFSCNQGFEGNPVAFQFDTDLVPPAAAQELRGLVFHRGHLYHYARRREWAELVRFLETAGPQNY